MKRTGPKTEPCGTPLRTSTQEDTAPPIPTRCILAIKTTKTTKLDDKKLETSLYHKMQ